MARSGMSRLRIAAILSTVVLGAGTLAACGGDEPAAETKSITVLSSFQAGNAKGDQFKKLADAFTAQTGITIDIEEANTNDIADRYEATKLANEERDLVVLNLTPSTTDWLPQGLVVNVKPYMDSWGITPKLQPEAVKYWTQSDGVAGVPLVAFNWPMWYNMDLLKKAGVDKVPATTDDLIAASTKLRAAGIQPMVLGGAEWPVQNFITWMTQQYVKPDGAQKLFAKGGYCSNPDAVKGLDLFAKLRDAGVFIDNVQGYTADQMNSAYFDGKAAMMPGGSWNYTASALPPAIASATTLGGFPVAPGGAYKKPTAYNGFEAGIFLTPNGEKKLDGIEKFFKFMYSDESLQKWVSEGSQIMAATSSTLGSAQAPNAMVTKGNKVTSDVVDFLLLPDSYIPAGTDYQPVGTEFLGAKGMTGSEFCKKLDGLYS